ncbi:MAG: 16S rRNA (uracil(1498)-N(3))-methyltransferase [Lachnospiraceae bacterium]|nr:16S rRNA (uracil(1498)-N(3))-methyltransferase [Lachnospiraceae bacterium]
MHQFFVDPENIQGKKVIISGSDVNHIKNVLRMQPGDELNVSNGEDGKEYRCAIDEIGDEVICTLRFIKEDAVELPSKIYLFQGLPKADKMEQVIQKCVELGVYEIIPVAMSRCIMKLDEKKAAGRIARWQEIARAAAKQSKRAIVPNIHEVMDLRQAVEYASALDVKLIPYEMAEGMEHTREVIENIEPGQSIGFIIGPEGGIDDKELETAAGKGFEIITLGKRILRTETAGPAVMSILMYRLESRQ